MERDLQPTIKEGEKGTAKQDPRGVGEDFTLSESKSEERQDTADVFSQDRLAEPAQGLDSKSQGDAASEEAFFQAEEGAIISESGPMDTLVSIVFKHTMNELLPIVLLAKQQGVDVLESFQALKEHMQ